jgi:hypothetical protein
MRVVLQNCFILALLVVWLVVALCGRALADPLQGEVLKFYQTPLNNGLPIYPPGAVPSPTDVPAPFPGHDELSTAHLELTPANALYSGTFMADDFSDKFQTPVVHVMWWGSYLRDSTAGGVKQFLISFETNGVDAASGFSFPDKVISSQIVSLGPLAPKSGTFTETPVPLGAASPIPNLDGNLFQYNAELKVPASDATYPTVEWIKIVALTQDPQLEWGWHNRDYGVVNPLAAPTDGLIPPGIHHFMDDAVTGTIGVGLPGVALPPMGPIEPTLIHESSMSPTFYIPALDGIQTSKDLAFALYTTPEPGSFVLLILGLLGLAGPRAWSRLKA